MYFTITQCDTNLFTLLVRCQLSNYLLSPPPYSQKKKKKPPSTTNMAFLPFTFQRCCHHYNDPTTTSHLFPKR
ncbi:hypothetical protein HYC85_028974 [Camellia sinensis]|uniref:Uncharacterized protein n=1 Tax=Camellia sinensis TaxID=4442 RepID=A0A7J7FWN6_CAMSI|nr:hypothetical protein HYC85_028974 [Camellia sinensis]